MMDMTIDLRANTFRIFAEASREMHEALDNGNCETAREAAEELEAIAMHTDWQLMRQRCIRALGDYEQHINGTRVWQ